MKRDFDIIYNLNYIVIVPKTYENLFASLDYTFGNAIIMEENANDVDSLITFINNCNIKDIIFVNYTPLYNLIMNETKDEHNYKVILTKTLGSLSNPDNYNIFENIIKLYQSKGIVDLSVTDKNMYILLNKKYDVKHVLLDIPRCKDNKKNNESDTVGILNEQNNVFHSFYNELSAIKLYGKTASISKPNRVTKEFINDFSIPIEIRKNNELIDNNLVNLNIDFSDTCIHNFLSSMDKGIPCLVGNNDFLDDKLKEYCFVKSDDDINEIKDKIKYVLDNSNQLFEIYESFRKEYSENSKKTVENFIFKDQVSDHYYEKLISVIVPVYNTEKYLETSLDSIIAASCDNMEILVINDGSTDNSEKIILKYAKKYPELIRYIKQKNGGLGNVRNTGLREAKGKYIASVDSDDTIDENYFTDVIDYLKEDIDIVIYDWLSIKEDGESFETPAIEWSLRNLNKYKGLLYSSIMPSTCNKIMKRSIIDELDIKYVEDKYEDLSTNPLVLLKANKIKYINKSYYEYYLRSGSLMRSSAGYSMINIIKKLDKRIEEHKDIVNVSLDEFKYYTYSWRIEEFILNQLYSLDEKELSLFIKSINDNIRKIIIDIFSNKKYKEMLDTLKKQDKEFIEKRNKAYMNNKLELFVKKAIKNDNYFKLSAQIIYYGYSSKEE